MKTVVAIHGSSRRKRTDSLVQRIEERLSAHAVRTEHVYLFERDVALCRGCNACLMSQRCPLRDDLGEIVDTIRRADGVIFSTPVYTYNVSAHLKNFFDRTMSLIHRPEFVAKPALSVVTGMGPVPSSLLNYMEQIQMSYGMQPAGAVTRRRTTMGDAVRAKELQRFASLLETDPETWRISMRQLMLFNVQKSLALNILQQDGPFWRERGWDRNAFYWKARISPGKKMLARVFYRMLSKRAQPYEPADE